MATLPRRFIVSSSQTHQRSPKPYGNRCFICTGSFGIRCTWRLTALFDHYRSRESLMVLSGHRPEEAREACFSVNPFPCEEQSWIAVGRYPQVAALPAREP
jgi:hypothetical protein